MFTLKSFIESIQQAILNASDALMDKNMEVLDRYFEKVGDHETQARVDDVIDAATDVLNAPDSQVNKKLQATMQKLSDLRKSVSSDREADDLLRTAGDLQPKTVTLNYPTKASDGTVTMKEVHVPLLTLVPIQFSQVEQLKLQADLELELVDDQVQVHLGKFSGGARKTTAEGEQVPETPKRSIGNVEILLKPQEASDGMQHIIDAYEKVLKAQLPN